MNNNYIGVDLNFFRQPQIQKIEDELGKEATLLTIQLYLKLAENNGQIAFDELPSLAKREFFCELELLKKVIENYKFFSIKNNLVFQTEVLARLNKQKEIKEAKSNAGKKGMKNRWKNNTENNSVITVLSDIDNNKEINKEINKENINNSKPDFKELLENLIPELKGYPALHKIIMEILEKPLEDQLPYFEFVLGNKTDITKLRNTKYWKEYFWADYWIYKQDQTKKPKQQQEDPELEAIFNVFK
jgi:hypothetical protein